MKKIMMKTCLITLPILCGYVYAASEPMLFTSQLNLTQVAHTLYAASKSDAPKPFYKKCGKVPASDYADARGQSIIWYNPATHVVKYAITYAGLSGSPVMAHFHIGAHGKGGPIVQTICGMPPKNNKALGYSAPALNGHICRQGRSGYWSGTYVLKGNPQDNLTLKEEVAALMQGQVYINIHTCLNQAGELRGQIVPYAAS